MLTSATKTGTIIGFTENAIGAAQILRRRGRTGGAGRSLVNLARLTTSVLSGIITTMKTQTIKIWIETLRKLRMIYAITGEKMVAIMDHLVTEELGRLRNEDYKSVQDRA